MPPPALSCAADRLQQLRSISASFSFAEGGSHGPDHSERVLRTALVMGRIMVARCDILAPAALLHDIGRKEERTSQGKICHARYGAEIAAELLKKTGYNDEDMRAICHCIRTHRFRGGIAPESLEARILFDADKLDSIGAVGIGRAFLFAGQIGARLHNPEQDHTQTRAYSIEDTAYREFRVKMSRVRGQMLTPIGRQIAKKRHTFMELFFAQLTRETSGILS
ncbi:HD domain-containing protein [Desulfobulbus alkaliphilus]|nr:HD domain-containing protein [Desulfobulbus alkaliphilus]